MKRLFKKFTFALKSDILSVMTLALAFVPEAFALVGVIFMVVFEKFA